MVLHNGETFPPEAEKKTPSSDFSQEELDLEMVVVCAGEAVKEVLLSLSILISRPAQRILRIRR
jgi:hypothetical protein